MINMKTIKLSGIIIMLAMFMSNLVAQEEEEDFLDFNILKAGEFKGHWTGFEIGLTNYISSGGSLNMPEDLTFMELNDVRSWGVNINLFQQSIGLVDDQFGVLSGIGFEFSNYRFAHNNSIRDVNGQTEKYAVDSIEWDKSKLTTSYLTVPLILEVQFPGALSRKDRLYIGAGIIGGLKLGGYTKTVQKTGGDKIKNKNHEDMHVSPLRYGYTFRLGFKRMNLYLNYYPVPLFEKGDGPEVYPVSLGFHLGI